MPTRAGRPRSTILAPLSTSALGKCLPAGGSWGTRKAAQAGAAGERPERAVGPYCWGMRRRNRLLSFGACALVLVLAAIAGPAIGGITGEAVAIALACIGGIAIVSLVFLEIGLSEDRERAATRGRDAAPAKRRLRPPPRRRRRPD